MIAAGNVYFYSLKQIFGLRAMSKLIKIKIHKTVAKPVVVFESETWAVTEVDMERLGTGESKIL
jgi:DNA integrity scanning protein DisA with diadenylate cyclase activity